MHYYYRRLLVNFCISPYCMYYREEQHREQGIYSTHISGADLGEQGGGATALVILLSHNLNYIFYFYLMRFIIIYI